MSGPGTRGGWHTSSADPNYHATVNFGETYHLYPNGSSNPAGMETKDAIHTLGRFAVTSSMGWHPQP